MYRAEVDVERKLSRNWETIDKMLSLLNVFSGPNKYNSTVFSSIFTGTSPILTTLIQLRAPRGALDDSPRALTRELILNMGELGQRRPRQNWVQRARSSGMSARLRTIFFASNHESNTNFLSLTYVRESYTCLPSSNEHSINVLHHISLAFHSHDVGREAKLR